VLNCEHYLTHFCLFHIGKYKEISEGTISSRKYIRALRQSLNKHTSDQITANYSHSINKAKRFDLITNKRSGGVRGFTKYNISSPPMRACYSLRDSFKRSPIREFGYLECHVPVRISRRPLPTFLRAFDTQRATTRARKSDRCWQ
jgi:hypothetical protein